MKKQMRNKIEIRQWWFILILLILITTAIFYINDTQNKYNKVQTENEKLHSRIVYYEECLSAYEETVQEVDIELYNLSEINKQYVDELNTLRKRAELYDKYQYAILDEDGKRTDLTYEEIKYGEELMSEYDLSPDLLFGTIMIESNGTSDLVNKSSGATGYGQFLDSTAQFVWTDLLKEDNYSSDIRKDGSSNIKMMAAYYKYLYSNIGNTFGVIKQYSGNSTDSGAARYLSKINSYTKKVGVVVD